MSSDTARIDRTRIAEHLNEHPGQRPSDVARAFDVHPSTAEYHLRRLVREGHVARVRAGRELHHYPTGTGLCPAAREIHARLTPAGRRVVQVGLEEGIFARKAVLGEDVSASAARWAMQRLEEAGVLERLAWGVYRVAPQRRGCAKAALREEACVTCNDTCRSRGQERRATRSPSPRGRIEASRSL